MGNRNKKKKINAKTLVLKYYSNAIAINVKCNNGDYYNIYDRNDYLGQGKTPHQAWQAAWKSINAD